MLIERLHMAGVVGRYSGIFYTPGQEIDFSNPTLTAQRSCQFHYVQYLVLASLSRPGSSSLCRISRCKAHRQATCFAHFVENHLSVKGL